MNLDERGYYDSVFNLWLSASELAAFEDYPHSAQNVILALKPLTDFLPDLSVEERISGAYGIVDAAIDLTEHNVLSHIPVQNRAAILGSALNDFMNDKGNLEILRLHQLIPGGDSSEFLRHSLKESFMTRMCMETDYLPFSKDYLYKRFRTLDE